MDRPLFLGVDIGTSCVKALLIDADGAVRAVATSEYQFATPRPGWAEQDAREWWAAAVAAIRSALQQSGAPAAAIAAVGLTGQMHGLVLLDAAGEPLRPCIMWNDQRTAAQSDAIHQRIALQRMIAITGKPALPNFTAPKLLWVRHHEPETFKRGATVQLPKDYVRYRLTGELLCDVADASGTSLLDVGRRAWSDEVIEALEIPCAWLPPVCESTAVCAAISREAANATGLLEGTPVIAGAGDQAAEAVGVGAIDDGGVSVALGTSGVVFVSFDHYRTDPAGRLHAYCHSIPGKWHVMGVMLSAGGSLRWFRDALGDLEKSQAVKRGVDAYEVLTETAADAPPGCEGLIFLPYLTGERTPHADPHARGAFIGLSLRHEKRHLTRAVMEGVTFGLLDSINLVRQMGVSVQRVRVSGGGARSKLWRQMMADIFNAEIVTVGASQGAAYGAALLATIGIGAFASADGACRATVRECDRISPGQHADVYPQFYERYRALYAALRDEFSAMARVVAAADFPA